ncbi:MAG: hypothetical protein A2Y62_21175 [Candidatus Fischerbacteria bacterium RBG_13_37_8]|uniref:Uncharacterized protein n=1 Tax=Candidatus Fischerbacteria bacterium RBG_13_37_8 TaxID=1817863 RepID=A0A1F5V4Z1_9BACT|nr:MAG: hypothetical protein A2Y62_21175 [Candidatus Fischerbacteria bacterium RBG_13_37_8]
MKLSKKEKQLCINKWQWFYDHPTERYMPEFSELRKKLNDYYLICPLCHHYRKTQCIGCPLKHCDDNFFASWLKANTSRTRKKYAGKLLEIMKAL